MASRREELMARLKNNLVFASKAVSLTGPSNAATPISFASSDLSRQTVSLNSTTSNIDVHSVQSIFSQAHCEQPSTSSMSMQPTSDSYRPQGNVESLYLDSNVHGAKQQVSINAENSTGSELRLSEPFMQSVMALLGQQNVTASSGSGQSSQAMELGTVSSGELSARADAYIDNGQNAIVSSDNTTQSNSRAASRIKFIGPAGTSAPPSRLLEQEASAPSVSSSGRSETMNSSPSRGFLGGMQGRMSPAPGRMGQIHNSSAIHGQNFVGDLRDPSPVPGIMNDQRNMTPIYGTTTISDRPGQYELGLQSLDRPPTMMQYSPSKIQVPMSTAERTKLVGAMEEMHSNVTVLEEALVNLLQMKELMLGRPTGQQRDALILENMRMQEEINDQLWALNQAAKEISDKLLKDVAIVAAMQQQQQHQQLQQPHSYQENHPNQPALGLLSSNPPNVPSLHYISAPTVKEPLFNSTEPQRQLLQNVPMQNLGPMQMQMVVGELYGQQQNPPNQVGGSQLSLHSVAQQIEQPVLEYIREKVVPPLVEVKAPLREPGLTMVKSAYDSIERSTSSSSSSSSVKKKSNKRARSHSYDKNKTRRRKGPTSSGRSHNDHSRSSRRSSRSRDRRRSHSRSDRKNSRSRSRSGSRQHSGSRRRSREKYGSKSRGSKNHRIGICGTNNKRYTASLTNKDRRSEEVKRGASQQKIDPVKVALDAKAETDRLAIEKEISTYMKAESYYDAGTEWCKKCNCVLTSVGDLCRHLHSDAHQRVSSGVAVFVIF